MVPLGSRCKPIIIADLGAPACSCLCVAFFLALASRFPFRPLCDVRKSSPPLGTPRLLSGGFAVHFHVTVDTGLYCLCVSRMFLSVFLSSLFLLLSSSLPFSSLAPASSSSSSGSPLVPMPSNAGTTRYCCGFCLHVFGLDSCTLSCSMCVLPSLVHGALSFLCSVFEYISLPVPCCLFHRCYVCHCRANELCMRSIASRILCLVLCF